MSADNQHITGVQRALTSPTLLPIDECEEWIWDILDSTKDSSFEYLADE
jgi:hypothetical protein